MTRIRFLNERFCMKAVYVFYKKFIVAYRLILPNAIANHLYSWKLVSNLQKFEKRVYILHQLISLLKNFCRSIL